MSLSQRIRSLLHLIWTLLLGMPPRNKYPAFRDDLDIESVREATHLLHQANRSADPARARALRYYVEKILYPPQGKKAAQDGLTLVFQAMVGENELVELKEVI